MERASVITSSSCCYYAAVTGQSLVRSKDYYDLVCSPNVPTVLVQLALFTNNSSRQHVGRAPEQQQWQGQQQQCGASTAAATAGAAAAHEVCEDTSAAVAAAEGAAILFKAAAAPAAVRQGAAHQTQDQAAPLLQPDHSTVKRQSDELISKGSGAGAPAAAAAGSPGPGEPPRQAAVQQSWALPPLTTSLLRFNVWATAGTAAAPNDSRTPSCAQGAAGAGPAAVYSEPGWLQDLQLLLPHAQQHL